MEETLKDTSVSRELFEHRSCLESRNPFDHQNCSNLEARESSDKRKSSLARELCFRSYYRIPYRSWKRLVFEGEKVLIFCLFSFFSVQIFKINWKSNARSRQRSPPRIIKLLKI